MAKINIPPIRGGFNLSKINSAIEIIEDHLNNKVLYRNNPEGEPNDMLNDLDMDGNRIYNLPSPTENHEVATKGYVDKVATVLPVGSFLRTAPDEVLNELPEAMDRAGKVLTFDANGQPTVQYPASDSATQLRMDLQEYAGTLVGMPEWSDVPAHVDPAFDVQTQALANRAESLKSEDIVQYARSAVYGAVRTVADNITDFANVKNFGAIGDGQYHPLSERFSTLAMAQVAYPHATSLSQSIDWAAAQAALNYAELHASCAVYVPAGIYVSTDGFLMPDSVLYYGDGVGSWDCIFHNRPKTWGGTNWLMYGVGAKTFATRGITSGEVSGGWRTDPDDSSRVYKLSSLMNSDATGGMPASPKNLSVAVKGKNRISRHWSVRGMRFVPWIGSDGVSDYSNTATTSLGDEWDIGICLLDSEYVKIENVQSVGYWREYGCLLAEPDFDEYGCLERNIIDGCKFQGLRGLSIRSADQWAILAKTSNTVEIAWSGESYWPSSGVFLGFPGVFTHYSYTGIVKSGDRLVFTGVSPDPLAAGLTAVRAPRRSTGAAGTIISNTFIHGLDHVSGAKAESFGLGFSTALEASGHPLRGIRFTNIKAQTNEAVKMFLHNAEDFLFIQSQWEGPGRIIATPFNNEVVAAAPIGDTRRLQLIGCEPVADAMFTPRSSIDLAATLFSDPLTNDTILSTKNQGRTLKIKTNGVVATALPNGDFGIGVENPGRRLHISTTSPEIARFERTGSTGTVALEFKNSTGTQQLHLIPGESNAGTLRTSTDNLCDLGSPSYRFAVVRAGTGSINTSDEREKTDWRDQSEAEKLAAIEIKGMIRAFKFTGRNRIHFGVGAQSVGDVMRSHGLNPSDYAFWCYDEWEEQPELKDEGGNIVQEYRAAGSRYGIRYDELAMFILAAM